jgi:enoyl-CoA hydratase/carnithine racemase
MPITFEAYRDKYDWCKLERRDGVLQAQFHTNGDEFIWDIRVYQEMGQLFYDIGGDVENKVVIVTGSGEAFLRKEDFQFDPDDPDNPYAIPAKVTAAWYASIIRDGQRLINNLMNIEAPIIGALNGPSTCHAEIGLLSDITLAAEGSYFSDEVHFPGSILPGDGVHVVWTALLGPNRGRYFLLTGQRIDADEALRLGVVNEVLQREQLLPRAWELAQFMVERPQLVTRFARRALTLQLRQALFSGVGQGLMMEGMAMLDATGS